MKLLQIRQTWVVGSVTKTWIYWDWRKCLTVCLSVWCMMGVGRGGTGGAQVHSSARHPEPEPINYLTCHLSAAIRAPLVDWYYVRLRLSDRLSHSVCWRAARTGCSFVFLQPEIYCSLCIYCNAWHWLLLLYPLIWTNFPNTHRPQTLMFVD